LAPVFSGVIVSLLLYLLPARATRQNGFKHTPKCLKNGLIMVVLQSFKTLTNGVYGEPELEDGKPKKVPYNPIYDNLQARASVKIPKSWGTLTETLTALSDWSGVACPC
jgi:hypothetical protein